MKPSYRETSCDVSGRIATVLLFVITLMSLLLRPVPARCYIGFSAQTLIGQCPGCDLNAHPNAFLDLSGGVPIAANTIESYTSGAVPYYCPWGTYSGSVVSNEHAKATAYVLYGKIGLSLSTSVSESPQYTRQGYNEPCSEVSNSGKATASSTAIISYWDNITVTSPGAPDGTIVLLRVTGVLDFEFNTSDHLYSPASLSVEITNPCNPNTRTYDFKAPTEWRRLTVAEDITVATGVTCGMGIWVEASTQAYAGWWPQSPAPPEKWIPSGSSGVTAMNTVAYYIDVLTPGASYYTNSGTIYPTSDSVHLDISLAGTGSGSVESSPAGIDCGPTCSAHFLPGTTIALTAIPAPGGSIFSSWSGDPVCTGGSVFMTETKSCTATFDLCPGTTRAQIGSTNDYDSISLAYGGAATSGDTIKVLASNQQEGPINFNSGKSVTLTGGYDCSFNNVVSYTVVTGSITITTGDVTIGNVVIL